MTACNLRRFSCGESGLLTMATNWSLVLLTNVTARSPVCAQARRTVPGDPTSKAVAPIMVMAVRRVSMAHRHYRCVRYTT